MKNKLLLILVFAFGFLASCTDNFGELNTDPKHPTDVPAEFLITNAQIELADQISSTNVNENIWKLVAQYWTETTYTDESNWDIVNRTISGTISRNFYRILKDFEDARAKVEAIEPAIEAEEIAKQNKLYVIDLMEVFIYQRLVDIFGDMPYSEALDYENYTPVYDDAATIYADLIDRATAAFDGLDDSEGSFDDADVIYGGDVTMWKKFAGAMLIKLGITIADYDANLSVTAVNKGATFTFGSMAEGAYMPYVSSAPYNNPLYDDLVLSGRADFVGANTLIDKLLELDDPRLGLYFTTVPGDTIYLGGTYGEASGYASYSHACDWVHEPDFPGILLTYDEVMFYLAEAAARGGYTVDMTAEEYFNTAVTENMMWWGADATDATDYLTTNPYSGYTDWKEAISVQGWIAMYTRGLEGYTFFRRLDGIDFNMPPTPPDGVDDIPTRFTYPINEQTLNAANYQSAASAIGGDYMTTKLFWDVN